MTYRQSKYNFRFWDIEKRIMIYDNYPNSVYKPLILSVSYEGNVESKPNDERACVRYIPMMWTGIRFCETREEGTKELWEGDIVEYKGEVYEIAWREDPYSLIRGNGFKFMLYNKELDLGHCCRLIDRDFIENFKLLGNIYRNEDIIKYGKAIGMKKTPKEWLDYQKKRYIKINTFHWKFDETKEENKIPLQTKITLKEFKKIYCL